MNEDSVQFPHVPSLGLLDCAVNPTPGGVLPCPPGYTGTLPPPLTSSNIGR